MPNRIRASSKTPCCVCGSKKWPCVRYQSEGVSYCKNVYAEKSSRDGLFMHFENDVRQAPRVFVKPKPEPIIERASLEHTDRVYSELLSLLSLSRKHTDDLMGRGLPLSEIERNGYKTAFREDERRKLTRKLAPLGLHGVPGFYRFENEWQMVRCLPGHFVPYRSVDGLISGLMYRLDVELDGSKYIWFSSNPEKYTEGTPSGAPLHCSRPDLLGQAREVWLTEGALKADIAAHYLDVPFLASAGVCQWGQQFGTRFKSRFPDKRVVIAYDADWKTNYDVRRALERLMRQLDEAQVSYVVRGWTGHKGIDDYVVALSRMEVAA